MKPVKIHPKTKSICRYSFHTSYIYLHDANVENNELSERRIRRYQSQSSPDITKMEDFLAVIDIQHENYTTIKNARSSISNEISASASATAADATPTNHINKRNSTKLPRQLSGSVQNINRSKPKCCRKEWFEGNLKQLTVAFRKLKGHLSSTAKNNSVSTDSARKESIIDKLRRISSNRKLPKAEQAKEWEKSIDNLLNNPYGIELFHSFLKTEFSEETLEFWLACEDFKASKSSEQKKIAYNVCSTFIKVGAIKQVNLDAETRNRTMNRLENVDVDMFDSAQTRVLNMMERESYQRFLQSEMCLNLTRQSNC